jgi:acetyl/propionyl-CoA carboxylase alpha subunit
LPVFREIVRDEEFMAGQLDTGFISRFNQRRSATRESGSEERNPEQQTQDDIALIAAAIHYARLQRDASRNLRPTEGAKSRWKMSGRTALHDARDVISFRRKKLNG